MYIKIYVPTQNDKISAYLEDLAKRVSKLFGGCTIIPNCRGFWINDQNQLVQDKIAIVESYVNKTNSDFGLVYIMLQKIALKIKTDLNQESVAFCIDNKIYFA